MAPTMRRATGSELRRRLGELAWLFLKMGTTAFGGPAAHVAIFVDEVVERRKWLRRAEFLDLLGATNLIPGPNSTEMAIQIGRLRAGGPGLVVAGACFIIPAGLLVTGIAWGYVRYGSLPEAEAILYGIKPVIIAVVVQAIWSLGKAALKTRFLAVVGVAALAANLVGGNELVLLALGGAVVAVWRRMTKGREAGVSALMGLHLGVPAIATGAVAGAVSFGVWPMFLSFLKVGSVLFGSGYVLLAFLRADFVERFGWLTDAQLLDAVAVGQMTPGPVFTTATFIGYILGGPWAALAATVGIFLPAFFFVAVSGPFVARVRRSPTAGAFLDGVNAASLALMAAVTLRLAHGAVVDVPTALLAVLAGIALLRYRVNSAWLVLCGAIVGTVVFPWLY